MCQSDHNLGFPAGVMCWLLQVVPHPPASSIMRYNLVRKSHGRYSHKLEGTIKWHEGTDLVGHHLPEQSPASPHRQVVHLPLPRPHPTWAGTHACVWSQVSRPCGLDKMPCVSFARGEKTKGSVDMGNVLHSAAQVLGQNSGPGHLDLGWSLPLPSPWRLPHTR